MLRAFFIILSLFLISSLNGADKVRLKVATAANLTYPIKELKKDFESRNKDIVLDIITGSSGKLAAQIITGAPFDILLSADMNYPCKLHKAGLTDGESKLYARGILILFTTNSKLCLSKGMNVFKDSSIKKIALANPKLAPYGIAAKEALTKKKLWNDNKSKLVTAENITQAVQFISTAADIGFVSLSTVLAPKMNKFNVQNKYWFLIDPDLYTPIDQGMVILKSSKNKSEARRFYEYLLTEDAGKIFCRYGYLHSTISKEQFVKGCFLLDDKVNLKLPPREKRIVK